MTITGATINGTNAADFQIVGGNIQTNLAPGATHSITVSFHPQVLGHKQATLEIAANENDVGNFNFGVALKGAFVDNLVSISPLALDFGIHSIDGPPTTQTVAIVHSGTGDLEIRNIAIVDTESSDFRIQNIPSLHGFLPAVIPSGSTGMIEVVFIPQARGIRTAKLRIESIACSNAIVEIALNGTATSTLDLFELGHVPSPQQSGSSIPDHHVRRTIVTLTRWKILLAR